jgi:hypothetical protein
MTRERVDQLKENADQLLDLYIRKEIELEEYITSGNENSDELRGEYLLAKAAFEYATSIHQTAIRIYWRERRD